MMPQPSLRSRLCYDRLEAVGQQLFLLERVAEGDQFLSARLEQLGQARDQLSDQALELLMEEMNLPLLESAMGLLELATLLATGQIKQARTLAEELPGHLHHLFTESLDDEEAPLMLSALGLAMAYTGSWSPSQKEVEMHLDEAIEVLNESILFATAQPELDS